MIENEELLPCPFCGSKNLWCDGFYRSCQIKCYNCKSAGPYCSDDQPRNLTINNKSTFLLDKDELVEVKKIKKELIKQNRENAIKGWNIRKHKE